MVHPQPEAYWGNVNPIGPRGVYDEAKRFAEALRWPITGSMGIRVKIVRIFNTYGPRMRRDDGRAVPTFVEQALRGDRSPSMATERRRARSATSTISSKASGGLHDADTSGPMNIGNPQEIKILELARLVDLRHWGQSSGSCSGSARGRHRRTVPGHRIGAAHARLGAHGVGGGRSGAVGRVGGGDVDSVSWVRLLGCVTHHLLAVAVTLSAMLLRCSRRRRRVLGAPRRRARDQHRSGLRQPRREVPPDRGREVASRVRPR